MDETFPQTAMEFEERFATEKDCIAYLRQARWPKGFVCPGCAGTKSWPVRSGRLDECASCGRQTSITAGTVFHGTRKPLRLWFRTMVQMLVSKQGCSAKELERLLGVAHETAWTWAHKLRALMTPSTGRLTGRVEVDESYVGGADVGANRGRSLGGHKVCVVAAVEDKGKRMGRARLEVLADASAEQLGDFVARNVEQGSTLHTDGWAAYPAVAKLGYVHERDVIGNPKTATTKLPHTHRVFSLSKRVLLATHQGAVSHGHLQAYLDEYVFRFNRRTSANRYSLVQRLLERVFVRARTYAQIIQQATTAPASSRLAA
jgi:transposase-like protein